MRLSLIVAVSENGVIGRANALIWHIQEDLARFKTLTMGHTVIMGRKCFESIGSPLTGRTNIVLTRKRDYSPPCPSPASQLYIAHSSQEALGMAHRLEREESFVIGGQQVYGVFLPSVQRIYMTRVHLSFEGDAFFAELGDVWQESEREQHIEAQPYPYSFLIYERTR
jgi:dihydrofolate reductase